MECFRLQRCNNGACVCVLLRSCFLAMVLDFSSLQTSLVMSVYLTISVSIERYISVVYPLLSIR